MGIGRNDPCPCGSGKKYKKCCLQKDVASAPGNILDFGYESDLAVRGKVVAKLDALMRETVYQEEVIDFLEEFWAPVFVSESEIAALRANEQARSGLEQQIPLAMRNALLIDDVFPAEYFLAHEPDRFTPPEQSFLRRFIDARITFIQLREFFPEAGYTLAEDLFDGREYRIFDKAFSRSGSPHAIVSARLVELPDGRGFALEQIGLGIFFPEDKTLIVAALEGEARGYSDEEWGETIVGKVPAEAIHAMLDEEPIFVYAIEILVASRRLEATPPRLTNTDGDPLVQIEARYRCDDPAAFKAALLASPDIEHESAEGAEVFTWTNREDTLVGLARLYPERHELVAETNSLERHRKWQKKLQSIGTLTLLEKRETPFDVEMLRRQAAARQGEPSELPHAEDSEAALSELKAHLAERWLREKIPALGGKTPVQAAKTAKGRQELKELFDYIESMQARMPADDFEAGWDVEVMKKRLGLPDD